MSSAGVPRRELAEPRLGRCYVLVKVGELFPQIIAVMKHYVFTGFEDIHGSSLVL